MNSKRSDIQILRALAVLAVIFFHINKGWVPNGFLGVDLFFLISGFVITNSLIKISGDDHTGNSIFQKYLTFYRRRIKRILPAALLVILLISFAILLFENSLYKKIFILDGAFAAGISANIRFLIQQRNYLDSLNPPSPFLHYWSLGVEEQFYLFYPFIFFIIIKSRKYFIYLITFFVIIFAVWQSHNSPLAYFYNPLSRSWELLVGASIAFFMSDVKRARKLVDMANMRLGKITTYLCLLAVIFALFNHKNSTPYSFTWELTVIIPAAFILLSYQKSLKNRLLEYIGEISFVLYLVHWPIIIYYQGSFEHVGIFDYFIILILTFISAIFIHILIEKPTRFKFATRKVVIYTLSASFLLIFSNIALSNTSLVKISTQSNLDLTLPVVYKDGCHIDSKNVWPKQACKFGQVGAKRKWLLTGDSHAAQWFPGLQKIASDSAIELTSVSRSSCPVLILKTIRNEKIDVACQNFQKRIVNLINTEKFEKVLISNFTAVPYTLVNSKSPYLEQWISGTKLFINKLNVVPSSIYFIEDTPYAGTNTVACLTRKNKTPNKCDFNFKSDSIFASLKKLSKEDGFNTIETKAWLCSSKECSATFNGHNTYRDSTHISVMTAQDLSSKFMKYSKLRDV